MRQTIGFSHRAVRANKSLGTGCSFPKSQIKTKGYNL